MREGWKEVTLGEILEIKHGYGFKGEYFTEEESTSVLVTPGNFNIGGGFKNDKLKFYNGPINDNFVLKENDVVVTMTDLSKMADTIGYSAKIPKCKDKIYLHNQRIGLVNLLDDSCDLNFIYWLLRTNNYQRYIAGSAIGATVKHTSPSKIYTAKVKIPTQKETQSKIANILSGYDDLIENNLKRIKILEEMAQQTYEEWFVRMRFPGYETAVFDDNGLPEGWEKVKLGEIAKINQSTIKKGFKGKIKYIDIASVSPNMIGDLIEYEFEDAPGRARRIVRNGDTIWSCVRPNRKSYALIINPEENLIASTGFCVITANKVPFVYLHHALTTDEFVGYLTNLAGGAAYPAVTQNHFENADIIIPTEDLLGKFSQSFESTKYIIQNLQYQNQRLREARDILLPRLMMGMIDVSGSKVHVKSVETKPTDAKVIPLEQPKREASKEFKEAVLIACLTERFGSEKFPLGRKRYTKLSYLFHRYSDNKIQDYLRKAAGPYNPKTKYGGPEKIALNNKYIQNWKGDKGTTGFTVAEKIDDAKKYFSNYWQVADLDWLTNQFKFKSNDELELLATVDNSLVELSKKNLEFTTVNVLDIIKSEKEWEAKLERTIFSDVNVERAIRFLTETLQYEK
ncbi:restriction endonuclease subunit S [uncultured Chryseobacterium sp.]|uniref:restriction endonuclease subunit S n=1 Tax=uncultured Chryseobacterium sp. TaxID=259322 RepID=UPI0025FDAB26|nr:restriction endonuclease subunit S [uncultured Chryseobacterium sp.]